jgi:predicted Zn finger-like uncharacterized protein
VATLADSIRRLGFRKWYERQLVDGHVSLVTCILCMILIAALLEDISFREGVVKAIAELAAVFAGGGVAWLAWRRYQAAMSRAWRFGEQAVCASCSVYARFEVVDQAADGDQWLRVRCRKCGHAWTLR